MCVIYIYIYMYMYIYIYIYIYTRNPDLPDSRDGNEARSDPKGVQKGANSVRAASGKERP